MDKLLAVLAMTANIGIDIIFRRVSLYKKENLFLFFTEQALVLIPLCVIGTLITDISALFDPKSILYGMPLGVLTYLYYFFALKCLEDGNVAVNVTIYRLNFVTAGIVAVLLFNEAISVRKIVGFSLCLLAILLFYLANRDGSRSGRRGYLYSIAACLVGGGLAPLIKLALSDGVGMFPLLVYRYVAGALIGSAALLLRRDTRRGDRRFHTNALLSGGVMMLTLYFSLTALKIGDVTVVMPIVQVSFVFVGVLAFALWKEKINTLKIIGMLAGVASIVIIA